MTNAASHVVFYAITLGGFIFAFVYSNFTEPALESCEPTWESMDPDDAKKAIGLISRITSVEKCYELIPEFYDLWDQDKDGFWSRCDDSNFLQYIGNTKEYALKYSHRLYRSQLNERCD